MKTILLIFITLNTLFATTLPELLKTALNSSPTLEVINERILSNKAKTSLSSTLSNPQISYLQNSINVREPMAQKSLFIKQSLPYFGILKSQEKILFTHETILRILHKKTEVALVGQIKKEAYTLWKLESLLHIVSHFEHLTEQNIALTSAYSTTTDNLHMGIMPEIGRASCRERV